MTKRVDIVNLSNWEGEDFEIIANGAKVVLRPGEHCTVSTGDSVDVYVDDKEYGVPQPFKVVSSGYPTRTIQTWPEMKITWSTDRCIRDMCPIKD